RSLPTSKIYTLSLHDALPISKRSISFSGASHESERSGSQRSAEVHEEGFRVGSGRALVPGLRGLRYSDPTRNPSSCTSALLWLRSEEHTSELQSRSDLVCRLL